MELVLIRHADAGDRDPRRYPDDRLRPLTAQGKRTQRALARALRRAGIRFDRFMVSPLVRARQTAEITAEEYGWRRPLDVEAALGEDFTIAALLRVLQSCPAGARVWCVGHEPHLSQFAAACLLGGGGLAIELPKSGVIGLEFAGGPALGAATLKYLLQPEHVLKLTVARSAKR